MPVTGFMMQAIRNGGATAPPISPAPPATTQIGFDFGSSSSNVAHTAPNVFVGSGTVYSGAQGYGYDASTGPGSAVDDSTTLDPRICGAHNWSNLQQIFRADLVNGSYKLRLAMGFTFGAFHQSLAIWDGFCGLGAQVANPSAFLDEWAAGQSITSTSFYRVYGANLYKAASTGTTGATPPTHTAGSLSDGTVSWTYVKTALYSLDVTPANDMVDGAGGSWSEAAWPASNVLSPAFTVTQGFVSITKKLTSNYGRFRHLGLIGQ